VTGTSKDLSIIIQTARDHYKAVSSDIANSKDRSEHIRLTALAQSAHNLLTDLIELETGLSVDASNETPLDIPEFRSPYNPNVNF